MCIAIPPPMQKRSAGLRPLRRLTGTPLALLGSGALVQLAALAAGMLGAERAVAAAALPTLAGALATLLMGLALERIPERLHALPPGYPIYAPVFMAMTLGGLLTLADGAWLPGLGLAALLGGWSIGLRALYWKVKWASGAHGAWATRIYHAMLAGAGLLAGMSLGHWQGATALKTGFAAALTVLLLLASAGLAANRERRRAEAA